MRWRRTGICVALKLAVMLLVAATARAATWVPPQDLSWYWQLQGTVDNAYGAAAYDIDGFNNTAAEVATLHAAGKRVICYTDVGTWENWRPDAAQFPSSVLGAGNGWPGEQWLDIRQPVVRQLMAARFQMCRQKGFDAIEPDNVDGYQNSTGFPLTAQDQLNFNEWVAGEAHSLGLAVFQKNDPDQAGTLEPYFDGALDEQCNQYSECSSFAAYLGRGKPVLNAEYSLSAVQFCASDNTSGIMGVLYSLNLDGSVYQPCWSGNPGSPPLSPAPSPPSPAPPLGSTSGAAGSPPGQPTSPAGAARTGPVMGIDVRVLFERHDAVLVRLHCPEVNSYCYGIVAMSSATRGQRTTPLGSGRFRIRGGRAQLVQIRLTTKVLAVLARVRSVRVVIRVVAHSSSGGTGVASRAARLELGANRRHA